MFILEEKEKIVVFWSECEFWTRNPNPSYDKETLFMLYDKGFLSPTPSPTDVNWYKLFKNWSLQSSNIIEIRSELSCIYPSDYIFNDREYRAWRSLIKAAGGTNITPFNKKESLCEFWTRNPNPSYDKETLFMLYDKGFLSPTPSPSEPICDLETCNNAQRFAKSISDAIDANKKGLEGKRRILSIVADNFTLEELRKSNVNF
ncbi:1080_t:CDS:2 [Entrophospora sp. SA101]|nr:1080_t:CDS:2 [Entrophospora sp. SA101]